MNNYLEINGQNFPDRNFRQFVLNEFDDDHDGKLRAEDTARITQIDCSGLNIMSLKGIEYFIGLESLICSNNNLENLIYNYLTICK